MALTATPPQTGPCSAWATVADVSACGCCSGIDQLDPDLLATNLTVASEILFRKSGMQFPGECSSTIRPCCKNSLCSHDTGWWASWGYPYAPSISEGVWYNVGPTGSPCVSYDCGANVPVVDLGQYPVTETEVLIDGAVLAQANYRLDGWRYLVRTDGSLWPTAQNLLEASTEVGTWSVEFAYGQPPPESAVSAASQLACELTKHCQGDQKCALPLRVTSINRQGVSYSLADVMDVLDRHKTGLYFVDLFLDSVNKHNLDRPPRVLSPDHRPPRSFGSG